MTKSKTNIPFVTFVNRKYKKILKRPKESRLFENVDDYILFLFYEYLDKNVEEYYYKLEDDLVEYSNMQQHIGKRRTNGKKS